jgi:hypothetical protein
MFNDVLHRQDAGSGPELVDDHQQLGVHFEAHMQRLCGAQRFPGMLTSEGSHWRGHLPDEVAPNMYAITVG